MATVVDVSAPRLSSSQRAALGLPKLLKVMREAEHADARAEKDLATEIAAEFMTNRTYLFKVKMIHSKKPSLIQKILKGEMSVFEAERVARGTVHLPKPVMLRRLKRASALIREARNSLRGTQGYGELAAHFGALMESINSHMRRVIGKDTYRASDRRQSRSRRADQG